MIKKSQKQHTDNKNKEKKGNMKNHMVRALGVIIASLSASMYAQAMPLLFVFIGGYLGVPADAKISQMDTMIWLLTSITIWIPLLYGFIKWMQFVWRRFVRNPESVFRKKTHVE